MSDIAALPPSVAPGCCLRSPSREELIAATASFRRDGYAVLRRVMEEELLGRMRRDVARLGQDVSEQSKLLPFHRTVNVASSFSGLRSFFDNTEIGRVVAWVACWPAVRLYHDMVAVKRSGDSITAWHQDAHYCPLDPEDMIGVWAPLVPLSREMGPLQFAKRSHGYGLLSWPESVARESIATCVELDAHFASFVADNDLSISVPEMSPGDVLLTHSLTLHRAEANSTSFPREAVASFYYRDGARVLPRLSRFQKGERDQYLAGCVEGGVALGPKNKLVFTDEVGTCR